MDGLDQKILAALQKDSRVSMAKLSEQIGLSLSACH
ncbi:MAG: AsnC family transcriptional regulator, partial [Roseibium sp.]